MTENISIAVHNPYKAPPKGFVHICSKKKVDTDAVGGSRDAGGCSRPNFEQFVTALQWSDRRETWLNRKLWSVSLWRYAHIDVIRRGYRDVRDIAETSIFSKLLLQTVLLTTLK